MLKIKPQTQALWQARKKPDSKPEPQEWLFWHLLSTKQRKELKKAKLHEKRLMKANRNIFQAKKQNGKQAWPKEYVSFSSEFPFEPGPRRQKSL